MKPIGWIGTLILSVFIIPLYRLYTIANRKIFTLPKTGRRFTTLLTSRYALHLIFILIAGSLTLYNVKTSSTPLSTSDNINTLLLAELVVAENANDSAQLIEDYPNPLAQQWRQKTTEVLGFFHIPFNPLTKEKIETETPGGMIAVPTRTEAITYVVQSGDTISGIARRFNISTNTILWENNLSVTSLLQPGDKLVILPTSGVSHNVTAGQTLGQIASLYGVSTENIMTANGLANPNQLRIGLKLVIPGGNKIAQGPKSSSTRIGEDASKGLNTIKKIIPGPSAVIPAGGRMAWPTTGHRITQYYSWRHSGVDIANKIGTPIYAADDGVVITVGYNRGGYGNQIVIDHGGGKLTRYGHLSAFSVNLGQKVAKGQYIAAMGSTGRSTGPHLHFEVIIRGQHYNPLNYVR